MLNNAKYYAVQRQMQCREIFSNVRPKEGAKGLKDGKTTPDVQQNARDYKDRFLKLSLLF